MTTYGTAETRCAIVQGKRVAYRIFGAHIGPGQNIMPAEGSPRILLMNQHFRGTMDHWDPSFINPICVTRTILLFDSYGVGRSEGEVPSTYQGWAKAATDLLEMLGIGQVDVFGFSMGGYTAQIIAIEYPELACSLILAGTGPSVGLGWTMASGEAFQVLRCADGEEQLNQALIKSFFLDTEEGRQAGQAYIDRMRTSRNDRKAGVGLEGQCRVLFSRLLSSSAPQLSLRTSTDLHTNNQALRPNLWPSSGGVMPASSRKIATTVSTDCGCPF